MPWYWVSQLNWKDRGRSKSCSSGCRTSPSILRPSRGSSCWSFLRRADGKTVPGSGRRCRVLQSIVRGQRSILPCASKFRLSPSNPERIVHRASCHRGSRARLRADHSALVDACRTSCRQDPGRPRPGSGPDCCHDFIATSYLPRHHLHLVRVPHRLVPSHVCAEQLPPRCGRV